MKGRKQNWQLQRGWPKGIPRAAVAPGIRGAAGGFTLIELMVAVGMMAVFMTIAIPTLYRNMQEDSMRKAVSDVMEACSVARARAILDSTAMELRIRPTERTLSVSPASANSGPSWGGAPTFAFDGDQMVEQPGWGGHGGLPERENYRWGERMRDKPARPSGGPGSFTVRLGSSILIEGLGVNGEDWTEDEEARVRFYPNGTCDEMSIVLFSAKGERRNIWLEVVTGFAELEADPFKFRAR